MTNLRIAVVCGCVLLLGLAVAWLYYPMRAVMDVGGACAEGGPYVIETPCPEGSTTFLLLGVPLWMAGVFVGLLAATISAPQPIFPGWALLFGALGWNFMDYAFHADPNGSVVVDWLVCGIVFWLMALPGIVLFVWSRRWAWVAAYLGLLAAGWWLGTALMRAWT